MTLPALLKRAGTLGMVMGLVASPLAMAQQDGLDTEPGATEQQPADPTAPADPASEPLSGADPEAPAADASDEPGFGNGTEAVPGASQPGSDPAQQAPESEAAGDDWEDESQDDGW